MSNQRYLNERARLVAALGMMTDGGILEDIQPLGAAHILPHENWEFTDLALAAYPMDETVDAQLSALGYVLTEVSANQRVKQFHHTSKPLHLTVIESGDEAWGERLITRNYLLHNPTARAEYAAARAAWQSDPALRQEFFQHAWDAASKWWVETYGFTPVKNLVAELGELHIPFHLVGGWALDLFLGRVRRVHHDLDVEIAYADQMQLQTYMTARDWQFVTPYEKRLEPWLPHMRLEAPRHQAHAHRDGAFIDFLLSDIENGVWRYRRDPTISAVTSRINLKTADGIPYLAPEIILLFKSRNTSDKERSKDETDFDVLLPHLEPARRAWLRWALLVTNPAHPWLERLA